MDARSQRFLLQGSPATFTWACCLRSTLYLNGCKCYRVPIRMSLFTFKAASLLVRQNLTPLSPLQEVLRFIFARKDCHWITLTLRRYCQRIALGMLNDCQIAVALSLDCTGLPAQGVGLPGHCIGMGGGLPPQSVPDEPGQGGYRQLASPHHHNLRPTDSHPCIVEVGPKRPHFLTFHIQ